MKYNIHLFLFILVAMVVNLCQAQEGAFKLGNDLELVNIYSNDEIESLEKIVSFVDKFVQNKTREEDATKAYHLFFTKWSESIENNNIGISPISQNEKYEFLEGIDSVVFNSIWKFDKHFDNIQYRDTILNDFSGIKLLQLKPIGRFLEYLKAKEKSNDFYSYFSKMMKDVGNLSASMPLYYTERNVLFDYTMIVDRLFAAIFILNFEYDIKTKLDVYFGK